MTPHPTPHPQIHDPERVSQVRRLYCRFYDDCLTTALQADWDGFACNSCDVCVPLDAERRRADMEGFAVMWSLALSGRRIRPRARAVSKPSGERK